MPLTRQFRQSVKSRAETDPQFRAALLSEAMELLLAGDAQTGRSILRDYINATIGFERLAELTGTPAKSLMRMFGSSGNPSASTLFAVIRELQDATAVQLSVKCVA